MFGITELKLAARRKTSYYCSPQGARPVATARRKAQNQLLLLAARRKTSYYCSPQGARPVATARRKAQDQLLLLAARRKNQRTLSPSRVKVFRNPAGIFSISERFLLLVLSGAESEGRRGRWLVMQFNFAELLFVAFDIFLDRILQEFHVRGRHNDAGLHGRFGGAGDHAGEVDEELGGAVGDEREVGVDSLGDLFI
jgi:hypothetical protein